ncbi:Sec1-like protein [Thermothelomyces heterothallicus CBS 202.75]|uniref:Sec1-like protein n=1 Tax=Thermothelomyces heterothallicus CBS 202.75 TaxID=1149848 RepID=UPI0037428F7D
MDGPSIIKEHGKAIIEAIRSRTLNNEWKVLVVDETSKRIIDSSVNEDEILNHNIANIERIEDRREMNPDMDAVYLLSPQPHIVECLLADFSCHRYRRGFIIWTGPLPDPLQRKLDVARRQMGGPPDLLLVDFYPRESHLVTFRDPSSFLVLYNPTCNELVAQHLRALASKIASVCITLQEFPKIRYYQPPAHATHEARVLCMHLARFVQQALEGYRQSDRNFPPHTQRPQSVLLVTDRSMDLMAPLLHEFTYQAMVHDLLPVREQENGKVTYHMAAKESARVEERDEELAEKDVVWVTNRHRHMKDTIDKLMNDFQKFIDKHPQFANQGKEASLNDIRDMLAGLPQFEEMKKAYSLHLTMAQEAMDIFQKYKLADVASVEQTLATGLDEDYKKPKNILDQVVRLLDDPDVAPADRLRLIAVYALYRDGMIDKDISRLLWHASLQRSRDSQDQAVIENLGLLGARPLKELKETRQPIPPLFPQPSSSKNAVPDEEYALSRFEPAVKQMLERLCAGDLDQALFPYVIPPADGPGGPDSLTSQGSLRSAAPRWASANRKQAENRQRVIVFVAGGATYSEARACYEVSEKHNRDVFLVTSHMVAPAKYLADLRALKTDRRRLNLPIDRPPPKPPAHLYERPAPVQPAGPVRPQQQQQQQQQQIPPGAGVGGPPTQALAGMSLGGAPPPGVAGNGPGPAAAAAAAGAGVDAGGKKKDKDKEKKKRNIFGLKK